MSGSATRPRQALCFLLNGGPFDFPLGFARGFGKTGQAHEDARRSTVCLLYSTWCFAV